MITADQPLWRIGALYLLSVVATDEGRLDEAEAARAKLARWWRDSFPKGAVRPAR